jgi:cytoskeletal protein RodZ
MRALRRHDRSGRQTLLLLALVFVVLLTITIIQVVQTNTPQEIPFERVFNDLAESDIQAVRLRDPNSDNTFTISRSADDTWSSPDHEGELDQEVATLIARTISTLPYDRALPLTQDTDLSEYGFSDVGVFAIDVVLVDGETHGLLVGSLAPSSTTYYVLADSREEIYPVYRGAIDFLVAQFTTPPLA